MVLSTAKSDLLLAIRQTLVGMYMELLALQLELPDVDFRKFACNSNLWEAVKFDRIRYLNSPLQKNQANNNKALPTYAFLSRMVGTHTITKGLVSIIILVCI